MVSTPLWCARGRRPSVRGEGIPAARARQSFELPSACLGERLPMRLMADERSERASRFSSRRRSSDASAGEIAHGGMVLERLARHTCRIAAVDWACLFVLDHHDPRNAIAAAGCGVSWDLIGARVGADEGILGEVLSTGEPALLEDHRDLVGVFSVEDERARPGVAVPITWDGTVSGVLCAAVTRGRP